MQGANPLACDSEGRTPLHHAVMRGHLTCVEHLLGTQEHAAALLMPDLLGCTPLHLGALQSQVSLILLLVQALLLDAAGRTPLHTIARRKCLQVSTGRQHGSCLLLLDTMHQCALHNLHSAGHCYSVISL